MKWTKKEITNIRQYAHRFDQWDNFNGYLKVHKPGSDFYEIWIESNEKDDIQSESLSCHIQNIDNIKSAIKQLSKKFNHPIHLFLIKKYFYTEDGHEEDCEEPFIRSDELMEV